MRLRPLPFVLLAVALVAHTGCTADSEILDSAEDVITFRGATMSELRDMRGRGPFRIYPRSPEEMLDVVERAVRKARDGAGRPVEDVMVSRRYGEVRAKEVAAGDDPSGDDYVAAVVVVIHDVIGAPDRSRIEIHAGNRGPFDRGVIAWEARLPGWIDEVLASDAPLRRIP